MVSPIRSRKMCGRARRAWAYSSAPPGRTASAPRRLCLPALPGRRTLAMPYRASGRPEALRPRLGRPCLRPRPHWARRRRAAPGEVRSGRVHRSGGRLGVHRSSRLARCDARAPARRWAFGARRAAAYGEVCSEGQAASTARVGDSVSAGVPASPGVAPGPPSADGTVRGSAAGSSRGGVFRSRSPLGWPTRCPPVPPPRSARRPARSGTGGPCPGWRRGRSG